MKRKTLRLCSILSLLTTGCVTEGYGPTSPDYYPQTAPPFNLQSNSRLAPRLPGLDHTLRLCAVEEGMNEFNR